MPDVGQPAASSDRLHGAGNEDVRRRNLSALLRHVHVHGPSSRSELTVATGLNRSTIATLVAELMARGLVRERLPDPRGVPGRPSPLVEVRHDGVAVLATEIFADSLAAAVVGLGGRVLAHRRVDRTRAWRSPEATVAELAGVARTLIEDGPPGRRLVGIGVAVAGLVRLADGFVPIAPPLGWRDVALASLVRSALPLDAPVHVGNDADLAALAEHTRGAGLGRDDFLLLWGEVGVGCGIVADGRAVLGRSGYAGEVGHLPVDPEGAVCPCGSRGCWETRVGEDALLRLAGLGDRPDARQAVDDVLAGAAAGDAHALAAVSEVGRWLGIGLAGLVNVLAPGRVALAGVLARLYPYVREIVARELDRRVMAAPRADVEIVAAELGAEGPLLGAAELAWSPILDEPTTVPVLVTGREGRSWRRSRGIEEVMPGRPS